MKIEKRQAFLTIDDFPRGISLEILEEVLDPLCKNNKGLAMIHLGTPERCFLCGEETVPKDVQEVEKLHDPGQPGATMLLIHSCPTCWADMPPTTSCSGIDLPPRKH